MESVSVYEINYNFQILRQKKGHSCNRSMHLTIPYQTVTQCLSYPYLQQLLLLLNMIMLTAQDFGLKNCYFANKNPKIFSTFMEMH